MTEPFDYRDSMLIHLGESEKEVFFVNTGVPHAVVFVDSDNTPVEKWGRTLRYHEQFEPAGTNANFVKIIEDGQLLARTYERGVEAETMACGTGAVASALIAALHGHVTSPVKVKTSGGDLLTIHFSLVDTSEKQDSPESQRHEQRISEVFLEGPALFIYEGELSKEAL